MYQRCCIIIHAQYFLNFSHSSCDGFVLCELKILPFHRSNRVACSHNLDLTNFSRDDRNVWKPLLIHVHQPNMIYDLSLFILCFLLFLLYSLQWDFILYLYSICISSRKLFLYLLSDFFVVIQIVYFTVMVCFKEFHNVCFM